MAVGNAGTGDIELWQRELQARENEVLFFWSVLSLQERERARRYYYPRDQGRFIIGRGWLRCVLASYAGRHPAALVFQEGRYNKPCLTDAGDLQFNLSHSDGHAVLAIARGFEVGVDVERIREWPEGVDAQCFSQDERAQLKCVAPGERDEAFFACWTRKEAFVKALGQGLSFPLFDFSVALAPGRPAKVLHIRGDVLEGKRWQMEAFGTAPGFIGAVAARRRGWRLRPPDGGMQAALAKQLTL